MRGIELGGKCAVFLARDERTHREVAVKLPLLGALADRAARSRLKKEAEILSRLDVPFVPALLDADSQDGIELLVMEYVEGPTLAALLQEKGPFDEAATLAVGIAIATALEAIHERGVIHCDLKPGNVVLQRAGTVKLLDFGQARLVWEEKSRGRFLDAAGTASYMAPERFLKRRLDPRADLWSLGVLLYELATGRRPFRGATAKETIHAILKKAPEPPTADRDISSCLDAVILRALEKDPDRRCLTAGEVRATLAASMFFHD
jgi:serine/threonine-protein kinase